MSLKVTIFATACLIPILSGCVGPDTNELLAEKPTQVFETSMTPDEARECFVSVDPAHNIPTPKDGGWEIVTTLQGMQEEAPFAVLILPTKTGSRVEYHLGHSPTLGRYGDWLAPCLERLRKG